MKYQVTFENGDQYVIESDLPFGAFAKSYPMTADIHPLVIEQLPEAVEEVKTTSKRRKIAQDAE